MQAFQRHQMGHWGEGVIHRTADLPGWGILRYQAGELRLQRFQLTVQLVVFKITDLRVILGIILPAVVADLFPQRFQPLLRFLFFHVVFPLSSF